MMFPDLERARPLLCHAPLCLGPCSVMIVGFCLYAIAKANGIAFQIMSWPMLAILVAGMAAGYQIKYRSTLSVRFLAAFTVYIVAVFGLLMGTAMLSVWSFIENPASTKPYLLFVFLYHAAVLASLALPSSSANSSAIPIAVSEITNTSLISVRSRSIPIAARPFPPTGSRQQPSP
ncbi:hypothetical protein R0290_02235 [Burkholderia semiarida]|uniref:hypothetical protein n=1 Tax=Burkholderia semiarida TaxID=2843303 RepID=UPI003459346D